LGAGDASCPVTAITVDGARGLSEGRDDRDPADVLTSQIEECSPLPRRSCSVGRAPAARDEFPAAGRSYPVAADWRNHGATKSGCGACAAPFPQRSAGAFSDDGRTIAGRWKKPEDGSRWDTDFDLIYTKVS
jgi:hypothetical protein